MKDIVKIEQVKSKNGLIEKNIKKFFSDLKKNKSDNDAFIRLANK